MSHLPHQRFLHLLLAMFSYGFCDQMNVYSTSTLRALDVTNEPFYKSKFYLKRTQMEKSLAVECIKQASCDALEKEMATHSSILAWKIPWTEKPGGRRSIGWQRVGHDLATKQ